MQSTLKIACLLFTALSANAAMLPIAGSDPVDWNIVDIPNFRTLTPSSLPEGITEFPPSLLFSAWAPLPQMPSGSIMIPFPTENGRQAFSAIFLHSGAVVGPESTFVWDAATYQFVNNGLWMLSAELGSNNYIGLALFDGLSSTYYGYLQFALHEYEAGQVAVEVLGGAINSVANEAVVIPGVPEPSTWALGAAGVALAVAAARRRRRG